MKKSIVTSLLMTVPVATVAADFALESADLTAGKAIADIHVFKGFDCDGGNVSPALTWKNTPKGTKSIALTVYDPDAPTGSGWWHWVMFNIPADVTELPRGAGDPAAGKAPKGAVQSRTDFGKSGWGGPCPPKGDRPHRYIFTVHALKVDKLDLDENTPAAMVGFMLNANGLGKASITRMFGRK